MFLDILNFVFVYAILGLILSVIVYSFFRINTDKKFSLLLGYGIAPLFISLILCYLYYLFPHKTWTFYASLIYGLFLSLLVIYFRQTVSFLKINFKVAIRKAVISLINSRSLSKIIFFFILFAVFFSFVRGSVYPNTWFDSLSYLQQGYVYSQDRSLDRLGTRAPFSNFSNNKITPPEGVYTMNTAICPALPILYSFFFEKTVLSEAEYFSTRFVYFYYFLLAIFVLYYYLKKHQSHALVGVGVFVSCFYALVFGPILNAKEIILLFLSFFSVMIIDEIREGSDLAKLKYAIIIGILLGLGIFINTSGIIIAGIIFLLIFKELGITKRAILLILTATLVVAVFSGFELKSIFTFVFNKDLISMQNTSKTFDSPEMESYKIASESEIQGNKVSKLNVLLLGKLQGITQIQFYGLIFIIFLITLFRTFKSHILLKKPAKDVLLYMGLFFFIVMDPLFLNPHEYAYVLSISPKYTVLLTIFAAFFIAYHFDTLKKIREEKNRAFIFSISSYFLFFISIASLISPVRQLFINILYFLLSRIVPIYNNTDYYINILNNFLLILAVLYIVFFSVFHVLKKLNKIEKISLTSTMSTIIVSLLILPNLFLLNSNYNIYGTLTHVFYPNNAAKVAAATNSPNDKQIFTIIDYINTHVGNNKKIYITFERGNSTFYINAWYFINNNHRLVMNNTSPSHDLDDVDYFLMDKKRFSKFTLSKNKSEVMQTTNYIIYKKH